MISKTHRQCGHCKGVLPRAERQCPYCGASLENYGAFELVVDAVLPEEAGVTKVILGFTILVHVLIGVAAGGTAVLAPSSYTLLHFGSGFVPSVLDGEYWRVVTPIFLHGGVVHIGFNLYALWLLGPLFEKSFGRARYLIIFMVSGVVSTAVALGWKVVAPTIYGVIPFMDPLESASITTSMVGMSGAICGLLGVGIATGHRVQNISGTAVRNQCLRWAGFLIVFGLIVPGVDNAAHFSGLVVGAALGWFLPLKDRAGYGMGWFWAAGAALSVGVIVGSVALHMAFAPLHLPADLELYPTGFFGISLRDGNIKDSTVADAEGACIRDMGAVERGDTSVGILDRAARNCDEILHYVPRSAKLWAISGQAHLASGDRELGCRRLRVGSTILRWDPANDDPKFLAMVEALENEACR
jgi:rhomboid protease GluP